MKRKKEEELGKKKKLEVKDFLLMQMGQVASSSIVNQMRNTDSSGFINMPAASQVGALSNIGAHKKGKAMNIEELRINKQLLKEISKHKKEKIYNSQEKAERGSVVEGGEYHDPASYQ